MFDVRVTPPTHRFGCGHHRNSVKVPVPYYVIVAFHKFNHARCRVRALCGPDIRAAAPARCQERTDKTSKAHPKFTYDTTIQLPGTIGGHGDWVAYDPGTQTIWLAQSPANNVVVINAKTDTVKATISGVDTGNGIAIAQGDAFVADSVNNVIDVIDTHTYQVVAKVAATGGDLDGVVYAPNTNEIYVASDTSNVLDAISIQNGFTQIASYALTPSSTGPDVPMYAKGMIYVPDGQVVDAVNPATGRSSTLTRC